MSNELRYTQYTYDAGIEKATKELRKQLAEAKKALEWYASPETWNQWPHADAGDRARMALAAIEPGKDGEIAACQRCGLRDESHLAGGPACIEQSERNWKALAAIRAGKGSPTA